MTRMNPPYTMSSSRFVSRASKARFFAYLCFVLVLFAVVYVFHGTQTQLQEAIRESDYCSQKAESISAKLQRANFHAIQLRNDLDKLNVSFANEKSELNSKIANAEQRYNEMNEKYLALKKEYAIVSDEVNDVRRETLVKTEENSKLSAKLSAAQSECNRLATERDKELMMLKEKLTVCQQNQKPADANEADAKNDNLPVVGNGPITPGVNPQALDSAADHDEIMKQNLKSSTTTTTASSANKENSLGAGVLPMPQPHDDDERSAKVLEDTLNVGGVLPMPQPRDDDDERNAKALEDTHNVRGMVKSIEDNIGAPSNNLDETENDDKNKAIVLNNNQLQLDKAVEGEHPNIPAPPDNVHDDKNGVSAVKDVIENSKQMKKDIGDDEKEQFDDDGEENDEQEE